MHSGCPLSPSFTLSLVVYFFFIRQPTPARLLLCCVAVSLKFGEIEELMIEKQEEIA